MMSGDWYFERTDYDGSSTNLVDGIDSWWGTVKSQSFTLRLGAKCNFSHELPWLCVQTV